MTAMYTVKQLSKLAGVSIRTLHYYDEIGLLQPTNVGRNGYRKYDEASVLRLQQILFYREIGLELLQIKAILDRPDFDVQTALKSHRALLTEKIERLNKLVTTIDQTIGHLAGEVKMAKRQLFEPFSDSQQKEYERSARLQYGPQIVNDSVKRFNSYSQAEKQRIGDEGNQVYSDLVDAIEGGMSPESAEVQAILERWHQHLRYFYEPNFDILRGLGELYNSHPGFIANFAKVHPLLAEFMRDGINYYVNELENAEIERLIAEDDQKRLNGLA